jgi:hypothetical protein
MTADALLQFVLGVLVLLAPGFALTWALAPNLDWAKFVSVGVVVSLSVPPATIYVLNIFLGVPFTTLNIVLIALAITFLGLAMAIRPRMDPTP